MNDKNLPKEQPLEDLARQLCCAFKSYQLGISFSHCMKNYMDQGPLGPYWYELAGRVSRDIADGIGESLLGPGKRTSGPRKQ